MVYQATSSAVAAAYAQQQARKAFAAEDHRELGFRLAGINDAHPHLNAATAMALAEQGYDRDSPEVKAVARLQVKRDQQDHGLWGDFKSHLSSSVDDYVKAPMRVGLAALDAPRQTVEGGFRELVHGIKTGDTSKQGGHSLGDIIGYQPIVDIFQGDNTKFNQSTLGAGVQVHRETGIPLADTLNNNPSVPRDGDVTALLDRKQSTWMSGPNSLAEKQQVRNARAADLTGGRATTYGRAFGAVVGSAPGGVANDVMSHILAFGSVDTSDPNDPRNGMTPQQRAKYEADHEKKNGVPLLAYQGDPEEQYATIQRRVQKAIEGGIDAGATFTPLDPVGYASGALGKARGAKDLYGGRTVVEDVPQYVRGTARVRPKPGPVPEGHVRLYRGSNEPLDPARIPDEGARFTTQRDYAEQHGGTQFLYSIDVPQSKMMNTLFGDALGDGPLPHTYLDAETASKATLIRAPKGHDLPHEEVPIVVQSDLRPTVVFENARDRIMRDDRLANYLARETDYQRLATVLGRSTPPETVLRLLDETDPTRVKHALLDAVGAGFINNHATPNPSDLAAVGMDPIGGKFAGWASAKLTRPTARWRQLAPSETMLPKGDPAWAVEQHRRQLWALRTGALRDEITPEFISKNVEEFARGLVGDGEDWSVPYKHMASTVEKGLRAHGVRPDDARRLSRIWHNLNEDQRQFWVDRTSGETRNAFVTVDGQDVPIAKASASAEMFTDGIPMLNHERIRAAAAMMNRLYQSPGWEGAVMAGDAYTALFKAFVLPVRGPAWAVRNVTEASARIAVLGHDAIINSPLSTLAWVLGEHPGSVTSRLLGKADRAVARGTLDPAGENFNDRAILLGETSKFARTLEHKGGPYNEGIVLHSDETRKMRRWFENTPDGRIEHRDPDWLEGNRWNLAKLAASPEYRMAVEAENPLHAKNMFWKSDIRKQMAARQPELDTREGADAFMDKAYERIKDVTNGNPSLRAAISTGQVDGVPLVARNARGQVVHNRAALDALEKHAKDLPDFTAAPATLRVGEALGAGAKAVDRFERGVLQNLFATFGSNPMNKFVTSPFMRQLTWKEAARLAPLASESERAAILAAARKARVGKDIVRQLEAIAGPGGSLTAKDVRDLAETRAFDVWLDTLYTSHRKGNWTRSARMLSPFAAAVADMYRFWSKALLRNPLILHRVDLGMQGARGAGFVYVDDNGEERFAYPLTRGWAAVASGIDTVMTGSVKGANMITSGLLPGFGPVVTWPVSLFLPDDKKTDAIRNIINPYGDPDATGGLFEGMAPGNVQRWLAASGLGSPEQKRRYTELQGDVMAYLASTGRYGNSVDEQRRLRDEAHDKAAALYVLLGAAQGSLPSSPRAEVYMSDPSGRRVAIAMVAADYRKWMREDPDSANRNLLTKYGEAAFYAVVGGTSGGAQLATEASHDLAREHPEVVDRYGLVWSYFTDPSSPYSHEEFRRQLESGDRTVRSLKDRQVAAQTSLASSLYWQHKDEVGPFPDAEGRAYLKFIRGEIEKQYPLWDQSFNAREVQDRVKQTFAAAKDPTFKDTAVADAVRKYEKARAEVRDWANSTGLTDSESGWGKAKGAAEGRAYLRSVAEQLAQETPEFGTLWQRVFDAEMVSD